MVSHNPHRRIDYLPTKASIRRPRLSVSQHHQRIARGGTAAVTKAAVVAFYGFPIANKLFNAIGIRLTPVMMRNAPTINVLKKR